MLPDNSVCSFHIYLLDFAFFLALCAAIAIVNVAALNDYTLDAIMLIKVIILMIMKSPVSHRELFNFSTESQLARSGLAQ